MLCCLGTAAYSYYKYDANFHLAFLILCYRYGCSCGDDDWLYVEEAPGSAHYATALEKQDGMPEQRQVVEAVPVETEQQQFAQIEQMRNEEQL